MEILLIILVAYLLGSIPSAVIISKLFYGFDIREKGSGNMGSTNTFRVLGWKAGLIVQILDVLKGAAAVTLAVHIFNGVLPFPNATGFEDITIVKTIAGIAAVVGHIWTAFAGFRGGKGINTALGMLIGIAPVELAVALGVFLLVVVVFKSAHPVATLEEILCLRRWRRSRLHVERPRKHLHPRQPQVASWARR